MAKWFIPLALGVLIIVSFPAATEDAAQDATDQMSIRLLFVGDLFFDRTIRAAMRGRGSDFPLSCVAERMRDYDLVIGNLEGPITEYPSHSEGSTVGSPENFQFTFPLATADVLRRASIRLVNLGNNHIGNFGPEGVVSTKQYLADAGVDYFGSIGEISTIYRTHLHKRSFSFIGFNEFGGLSVASTTKLIRAEVADGRMVFVYAHWGDEYAEAPPRIRAAARTFIDAGAAAVFGSHPHVVLPKEIYKEKSIYHSLGNFLFDQYWSDEVSHGLVVEMTVEPDGKAAFRELPTEMRRDHRVCFREPSTLLDEE